MMCFERERSGSNILSKRIFYEWENSSVRERNWNFEYTSCFYSSIIKLLVEKNRVDDLYLTTKDFTLSLTLANSRITFMDKVFELISLVLSKPQTLSQISVILKT